MPNFELTGPDGKVYDVEAADMATAVKDLNRYRQDQMNKAFTKEADEAPAWAKPFMALQDVARVGQDTLSLGFLDKFADKMGGTGDEQSMKTAAAKNRMGWAGTGLEAATLAGALPTAIPKVVRAVGGGPAVRTLTGAATGATEGAGYGAATAAGHDQDVAEGSAIGGVTGILGPTVGAAINKGVKKFGETFLGKNYNPPNYRVEDISKFDKPSRIQRVSAAMTEATDEAAKRTNPIAKQSAYVDAFENIPRRELTKPQQSELLRVVQGDLGTDATRVGGKFLGDKFVAGGAGFATGSPILGLLAAAGTSGAGNALQRMSLGGTKEAAENLRRMVYGVPEFRGPVSEATKAKFAHMARQLGLDLNADE